MNISPDGVTVRFTTEPEELFLAEKSGAKPNTVKILDSVEREQLIKKPFPEKIIIRHGQEIFLRTVTHVYVSEMILGKSIAIFSWTNVKHIHTMPSEPCPGDHNMSLACIGISREMSDTLTNIAHGRSMDKIIRDLYQLYCDKHYRDVGPLHD